MHELIAVEEQAKMPYVTSIERLGREEGHKEGHKEGYKEGRQEGEALVIMRLIELKFGTPSEAVRAQINAADADTLLRWSERILTAQSLDEVLR